MKKAIATFLIIVLLITSFSSPVNAETTTQQANLKMYIIDLVSTEMGKTKTYIYVQDDIVFMDLEDVLKLTRTSIEDKGNSVSLKQGTRTIVLDSSAQTLEEAELAIKVNDFKVLNEKETILVPAFSLLTYLGANCTVEGATLTVSMPAYTLWEATDFDYSQYSIDIHQIWGDDLESHLWCDIIMQMIYGVGLFGTVNDVIKDAMYSVLDVDMYDYQSVNNENTAFMSKVNNIYANEKSDALNKAKDLADTAGYIVDVSSMLADFLGYGSMAWDKGATKLIHRRVFSAEVAKMMKGTTKLDAIADDLEAANDILKAGLLMTDIFVTIANRANYTQDTIQSMSSFKDQYKKYYPDEYRENAYYQMASSIALTLKNKMNTSIATTVEKTGGFIADKAADFGFGSMSQIFGGSTIWFIGLNVGKFVTGIMNQALISSADADMKALLLTDLQSVSYKTIYSASQDIVKNKKYNDYETLTTYRDLWIYWLKTTMAINDKLIEVYTFNKQTGSADALKNRNEGLALQLFKISYCSTSGIVDPSAIYLSKYFDKQLVLSGDNEVNSQSLNQDEYSESAYIFVGESGFYYIGSDDQGSGLFKYDDNIGKKVRIAADCDSFIVTEDFIYYNSPVYPDYGSVSRGMLGGELHRCDLNGKNNILLKDIRTAYFVFNQNQLYYYDLNNLDGYMYRCDSDGGNARKVFSNQGKIMVNHSMIYTCEDTGVYACSWDGSGKRKISDFKMYGIGIYNNRLLGIEQVNEPGKVYLVMIYLTGENNVESVKILVTPPPYGSVTALGDNNGLIYYTALNDEQARDRFGRYQTVYRYNYDYHDSMPIDTISSSDSVYLYNESVYYTKQDGIHTIDSSNNTGFIAIKNVIQILTITDEWVYFYTSEQEGPNSLLKRYNTKTKEIQDFGLVYTYRG